MDVFEFAAMIEESSIETKVMEYYDKNILEAVCLTDVLSDGLSMVYSFFDPDKSKKSLGTFMILDHISVALDLGLPYLYLGYWVPGSQKMDYKVNFKGVEIFQNNKWRVLSENEEYKFEKTVIASGAFSKKLTDKLHEKIPLDTERGYHVHFKDKDKLISRPVIFLDRGFGMTPMNQGLRAVGTVELGGLKNPPSKKRIEYIINCAKELLPQLGSHHDEWLGFRPTLPDFLPILGPSLKNKNIIYAFGHQHLGWTLGAITGKIISGIVAGDKTNLNLAPYSSKRFN